MRKQITYTEPIPEFDAEGRRTDVPTVFSIIANGEEEMEAVEASIRNPERGITKISKWSAVPPSAEDLIAQMEAIDLRLIRPMAAITEETATAADRQVFSELMGEKRRLREKMQKIGG